MQSSSCPSDSVACFTHLVVCISVLFFALLYLDLINNILFVRVMESGSSGYALSERRAPARGEPCDVYIMSFPIMSFPSLFQAIAPPWFERHRLFLACWAVAYRRLSVLAAPQIPQANVRYSPISFENR